MADPVRELEHVRTCEHPDAVEVISLLFPDRCGWPICAGAAYVTVNHERLCDPHAARQIGRLLWDSRIRGVLDLFRREGWPALDEESA